MLQQTISHEIFTPVNSIETLVHLLTPFITDDGRKYIDGLHIASYRLMMIAQNLADLGAVINDDIPIQLQYFDLDEAVEGSIRIYRMLCEDKAIDLDIKFGGDFDFMIKTDIKRVRQMVFIVLGNAQKHTQAGGKIKVRFNIRS